MYLISFFFQANDIIWLPHELGTFEYLNIDSDISMVTNDDRYKERMQFWQNIEQQLENKVI